MSFDYLVSGQKSGPSSLSSDSLQLPTIYHFLPHLLSSVDSLKPAFRISKSSRSSVTMVFGVPTVRRDVESYLVSTLHNLIDNLSPDERSEACIVVFVAEVTPEPSPSADLTAESSILRLTSIMCSKLLMNWSRSSANT